MQAEAEAEAVEHSVLLGTMALLELARAGHWVIQVNEPRHEGQCLEFTVHVPTTQRGRPKKDASTTARLVPSRRYFVSPTIATLCEEALESKHPTILPERICAARSTMKLQYCNRRMRRGQRRGYSDLSPSSATDSATNIVDYFDLDCDDNLTSSSSGGSVDGGLGCSDDTIELANAPIEWLPREESWAGPLPEMAKSPLGPEAGASDGYNYTDDAPRSEMLRAYETQGARERGLSQPWSPSDWLSADVTAMGDSDFLQSSSPQRKKQKVSGAILAGTGTGLLLVAAVLAVQNQHESNDSRQSQESPQAPLTPKDPSIASNTSFACNVGCPPGSFAIGRVCNRRSDTSLDFTGGHCAEWTLEGMGRSTKLAAADPWPSFQTHLFGTTAQSPAWSGVALDGDGSDSGLWIYTVASNLSDASGLGPGADSTCPTMWHYSRTDSKWSRVGVQTLHGGECVGAPDPTPMPSPRIQPHTFVDSNSGLLFLHGGSGCPKLDTGKTPSGASSCQMPGGMTDMWAFTGSESPSLQQKRWIAAIQEDPFGASCSTSNFNLCASGIRLGATISPLTRTPSQSLSDTAVATGSVYLFGGYELDTRRSLPHLWRFSYEYDRANSRITGRWTILASQRSMRSVASSEKECNVGSDLSVPEQVCDICDVAPCPDARAGAASWSGGKRQSEGGAVGWIFGGYSVTPFGQYSMEEGILFNDLWQLNDYDSVVGPMSIWDYATNADSSVGLGSGLWSGPKHTISSSQPLWRQIQHSGVAESVVAGQSQPYRLATTIGTWPTVVEFGALGSSTEIGALWMLTGYESPYSPTVLLDPIKLKEHMTPTLWSFEISTRVWSRVQLVEDAIPMNHNISAIADGLQQTLWPATRTQAMIVGESCTHSGANIGHSRDGIGAGWLLGGYGDRECSDNVHHQHSDQQKHFLPGLWRLAVAGKGHRAQTCGEQVP